MNQRSKRKPDKPGVNMHVDAALSRRTPSLGREIQERIGQQLRAVYNDVVAQGVPERFSELLRRLDKRDGEGER